MKSKNYLLVALIVALLALPVSAEELLNPGFDDLVDGVPSGANWLTWGGNVSFLLDGQLTEPSYEGPAYCELWAWGGGDTGIVQEVTPVVGTTYEVSVWILEQPWGSDLNITFMLHMWDALDVMTTETHLLFSGADIPVYTKYSATLAPIPAGTVRAEYTIEFQGEGTVALDSASMIALGAATNPVPADGLGVPTSTDALSWTNYDPLPAMTAESYVSVSTIDDPNFVLGIIAESGWITGETVNLSALTPSLTLTANKNYFWRVDSRNTFVGGDVPGTVWNFNTFNLSPVVDAGIKQNVWLESGTITVDLDGTATDDALPNPPAALDFTWSASGPGAVVFDPNDKIEDPTATFTTSGTYVLTLTADDGVYASAPYAETTADTVTIVVYAEADIDPIAAWPLDTDATEATDAAKDGTLVDNAVIDNTEYQVGTGSLLLDGDGDVVEVLDSGYGTDPNLTTWADLNDEVSITLWAKSSDWQWNWTTIAAKGYSGYRLQRNSDTNAAYFAIGQTIARDVWGNLNILDEKWHHLAGTYDGDTVRLYVDGILEASSDARDIPGPFDLNGDNFKIGDGWNGNIDMVRIYDRGLSQKIIRDQIIADGGIGSCKQVYSDADVNKDCYIDIVDIAIMAAQWLECRDTLNTAEFGGTCVEQ